MRADNHTADLSQLQRTSQTDLPPHEEANALIAFFFSDINDLHYPIDKRAFLRGESPVGHVDFGDPD